MKQHRLSIAQTRWLLRTLHAPTPALSPSFLSSPTAPQRATRCSAALTRDPRLAIGACARCSTAMEPERNKSFVPVPIPDRVLPVSPFDVGQPDRVVYIMMRFDAVLDVPRLQDSLETLLSGQYAGWSRLGARLRRNPRGGRFEYHVPAQFSATRPAVAFSHNSQHAGVSLAEHPRGRQLPRTEANPDKPYLGCNVDTFTDWMRPSGYPERLEEYLTSDVPLLGVHVVSFRDATLVTFAWLHVLSDIMGVRELFQAWVAVLEGRPHDVRPVNDIVSDWSMTLVPPPPQPASGERAGLSPLPPAMPISSPSPSETTAVERRFVCFPARYMQRLGARAAADLEMMQQLAQATSGDECGPLWVSSGDLASALIARVSIRHVDPPLAPDDNVHILNATSIRHVLEDDLIPAGTAHVGNAVTAAMAQLPASDLLTKPLACAALSVRRAIQRLMKRETLVLLMAALVSGPARIMQSQGEQGAAAKSPGQTKRTCRVFITNWSKAGLFETDFSAAVVSRGPNSIGQGNGGGGRPSHMIWHSSGGRLKNTAIVTTDPYGTVWWSCQLRKDEWAELERNLANGAFEDS